MDAKQGFNIDTPERSVDYAVAGYSTGSSITFMSKTREVIKANQDITPTLPVNRQIILNTLIKHETLTEGDIAKEENLGVVPNKEQLGFLLSELHLSGHIQVLTGAVPVTYSITQKGIDEGKRLERGTD